MEQSVIIAGFGGQGILLAGEMLANALMLDEKNVTWYPCYGAEMRGGTVNCEIVASDAEVSSVNKKEADFIIALNQLSFDKFQEYLAKTFPDKPINVRKDLVIQMKNLVTMSMLAVRRKLNPENRAYCMEIFGYDFIIDEEFKVWLIEINTNPCLEESSKLLQMLPPRMIGPFLFCVCVAICVKQQKS